MTYYSRELKMPKTKLEGLCNVVQMIINEAESGNSNEAMLIAVDLLDTLSGKANAYASVTDGSQAQSRQIAELEAKHANDMAEAIIKATEFGAEQGRRLVKAELAKALGLA